jgi:hypothetical protein
MVGVMVVITNKFFFLKTRWNYHGLFLSSQYNQDSRNAIPVIIESNLWRKAPYLCYSDIKITNLLTRFFLIDPYTSHFMLNKFRRRKIHVKPKTPFSVHCVYVAGVCARYGHECVFKDTVNFYPLALGSNWNLNPSVTEGWSCVHVWTLEQLWWKRDVCIGNTASL